MIISQPLQYFFSFDYGEDAQKAIDLSKFALNSRDLGLPDTGLIHVYPQRKFTILARITNLNDKQTQKKDKSLAFTFDLDGLAKGLWKEANPSLPVPKFEIKDLSLSANQPFKQNEEYKSKNRWVGEDDAEKHFDHSPRSSVENGKILIHP